MRSPRRRRTPAPRADARGKRLKGAIRLRAWPRRWDGASDPPPFGMDTPQYSTPCAACIAPFSADALTWLRKTKTPRPARTSAYRRFHPLPRPGHGASSGWGTPRRPARCAATPCGRAGQRRPADMPPASP